MSAHDLGASELGRSTKAAYSASMDTRSYIKVARSEPRATGEAAGLELSPVVPYVDDEAGVGAGSGQHEHLERQPSPDAKGERR